MNAHATLPTLVSVVLVSLLALLGAVATSIDPKVLPQILRPVIGAAIGVLVGEAVLHLIPESISQTHAIWQSLDWVGLGVIAFAAMEFILRRWAMRRSKIAPVGLISAVAEAVHNAVDGALIASSYLADFRAGVVATVAVAFHEIPHELGNVAVLVHAGFTPRRAVMINLLSASTAIIGAVAFLVLGDRIRGATIVAGPLAAGGFLYLALGILAPELWTSATRTQRSVQGVGVAAGFLLTAMVAWLR